MTKIFMAGPRREAHQIVITGPAGILRPCYKNFRRASHNTLHTSTSKTWHLKDLHAKDLLERIVSRTSARSSCKDRAPGARQPLCASRHSRNAHGLTRAYARIYRKNAGEQRAYPDLTTALFLTVRIPVFTHCLGKHLKSRSPSKDQRCFKHTIKYAERPVMSTPDQDSLNEGRYAKKKHPVLQKCPQLNVKVF